MPRVPASCFLVFMPFPKQKNSTHYQSPANVWLIFIILLQSKRWNYHHTIWYKILIQTKVKCKPPNRNAKQDAKEDPCNCLLLPSSSPNYCHKIADQTPVKTLCYSHRSTWLFAHPQNRSSSVFGHQPNKSSSLFFTKLGTDADLGCHRRTPRMSPYRPRRTWKTPPFATTTAYCCDWVVLASWDTGFGFVEECTVTHTTTSTFTG